MQVEKYFEKKYKNILYFYETFFTFVTLNKVQTTNKNTIRK